MWSIDKIKNQDLVQFIRNDNYFESPFLINSLDFEVIYDGNLAEYFAREYSDNFSDWQSLWDNELDKLCVYDEISGHIEHKISQFLDENFHYGKNFNGALQKIGYDENTKTSFLFNNMEGDLFRLLQCDALEKSSHFINMVRQAYLNNGFPCGWSDLYPKGKLVVFSNEI